MKKDKIAIRFQKVLTIFLSLIVGTAVFAFPAKGVFAQVLRFEIPESAGNVNVGDEFQINVLINTEGEEVISSDALIEFDSSLVDVQSAESGDFFTYFSANPLGGTNDKFLASSWEESVAHAKSANTDTLMAILNVTAIHGGSAVFSFDCTAGTEADSNINRASDAKDIINCSQMSPLSLNIDGSVPTGTPSPTLRPSPTASPSATSTPSPTRTPTPTRAVPTKAPQLVRAGVMDFPIKAISFGTILTIIGVLAIL